MLFALSSLKFMQFDQDEKQKKLPIFMLLLLMLILIVVKNSGGYAFILLLPFFMAIKLDTFQKVALFLLVLPVGIQLAELNNFVSTEAFFSGEVVDFVYVVDTGMVLRPLIFLVLYVYLSLQFVYGNALERRVVYG
jgi:hypothetical protein